MAPTGNTAKPYGDVTVQEKHKTLCSTRFIEEHFDYETGLKKKPEELTKSPRDLPMPPMGFLRWRYALRDDFELHLLRPGLGPYPPDPHRQWFAAILDGHQYSQELLDLLRKSHAVDDVVEGWYLFPPGDKFHMMICERDLPVLIERLDAFLADQG